MGVLELSGPTWMSETTPTSSDLLEEGQCFAWHWRHEPFLVACKTFTKPFKYVIFVVKFMGATNLIEKLKFTEDYVTNNKPNQIFKV